MKHLLALLFAGSVLAQGPVAVTKPDAKAYTDSVKTIIDKQIDATNCNNTVTAANGQFTIYSAQVNAIRGATATSKQGNRWRGVTLINSASNSVTFQVWSNATLKVGAETNDWSVLLFK